MGLGELEAGDTLLSRYGLVTVAQVTSHPAAPVYNIGVDGQHVYEVTEWGIVVHNNDLCKELQELRKKKQDAEARGEKLSDADQKRLGELEEKARKGELDVPKSGTLSNVDARKWYLEQESKILGEIDPNLPLRDRAIQAFNRRNELRTKARELMADREEAERLMREEPNMTLRDLLKRKYQLKGLVGDELWQDILDSSQKSRSSVNKKLGLE